ncbi:IclR family transcriptional regulator [Planctomicrobium sp. SH527]|uniref:IclR family transcriptional regulator n=1 Tax=Planctomicrobium sp. SH527 TaxID=3448123 RepID=UPI003F5B29E3
MDTSSLGKAFHVLEVLAAADGQMPLVAIVTELGYHKPTVHRLLQELVSLGYVSRVEKGKYQITPKLRRLTLGRLDDRLAEVADRFLRELHDKTGETVNLGVLRGVNVRYLQVLESRHPFRRVVEPNSTDPFYSTALGRVLTARLDDVEWDALITRTKLVARTPFTTVVPEELTSIHQLVRENGYAIEQDQNDIGVTCIGAPVFENNEVVAAVSISLPTARVNLNSQQSLIDAVVETARQISSQLSEQK